MVENKRKTVALVIGSGGAKPFGLIPFFKMLEDHQLKPDAIFGCSGGCLLGSLWAAGYPIAGLEDFLNISTDFLKDKKIYSSIDYRTILSMGNYPGGKFELSSGMVHTLSAFERVKDFVHGRQIEDSIIKTTIFATDLETGQQVALDKGSLAEAMYASCAVYPMFNPLKVNNRWLVDGAYYSALPIIPAIQQGYDKIIAISFEDKEPENYGSFFEFYLQFIAQVLTKNSRKQNSMAIDLHHDEILFLNVKFDRCVRVWEIGNFDYLNSVTQQMLDRSQEDIIAMFNQ